MKRLLLGFVLSVVLIGCTDQGDPSATVEAEKLAAADRAAGKALVEGACVGCHGLDGRGAAPAIPHLAAQRANYLLASLQAYKEGKRVHAALNDMTTQMSETDIVNVAVYFADLPPIASAPGQDVPLVFPYERGNSLAKKCARCHGLDGNSSIPGTPSFAGQQPVYFVTAIQEYMHRARAAAPMHPMLWNLSREDRESLALYYASQTPARRAPPAFGDPALGEPLTAVCGGCHGSHGVSTDSATPTVAGQDAQYLVAATKAYRGTRRHEVMRRYVVDLTERDIEHIAAFYSVQESKPAEKGKGFVQDLAEKCDRCHAPELENASLSVPKIRGQDRDYLIMALRAYRDDRRASSLMHKMSVPYSDSIIESISSLYSRQPAR